MRSKEKILSNEHFDMTDKSFTQTVEMHADNEAPLVLENQNGKTLRLTLNSPRALNSLSLAMIKAVSSSLEQAGRDHSVRAIIINGAGKGFCAGHDLKEITHHRKDEDKGKAYFETLFKNCTEMMLKIAALPVPVIAEVHGVAAAAGCQLVASCDLAIAEKDTVFAVNGIDSGLFCSTPQVALSRNIPRKAALEMLMLGKRIDAARAEALGLINRVVSNDELKEASAAFAASAGEKSRRVIALGKAAFYRQVEMNIKEAYDDMGRTIVDNLLMDDAICGIDAFINKQKPQWD